MSAGEALLNLGIAFRPNGPAKQRLPCRRCDKGPRDTALDVNIEQGLFHCHRCGWSGRAGNTGADNLRKSISGGFPNLGKSVLPGLSDWARELWERCLPLGGTALAYLKARGCVIPPSDGDLRYSENLLHRPSGYAGPALVALVTDAITGEPMTLHRTWICPDGSKAPIERPRMLLAGHSKRNGVIRLWPDVTQGLAVAEGLESACSAAHVFEPIWSCIDAGNLARLPVLPGIDALTVYADHDDAGVQAARTVGQRWANAAREVTVVMPITAGQDINDLVAAA